MRNREAAKDEPPPFLRTWPRLYCAVITYLLLLITALYTFTRWLSFP